MIEFSHCMAYLRRFLAWPVLPAILSDFAVGALESALLRFGVVRHTMTTDQAPGLRVHRHLTSNIPRAGRPSSGFDVR